MTDDANPTLRESPWELGIAPPPERWDDWTELDSAAWPERVTRNFRLVPSFLFLAQIPVERNTAAGSTRQDVQRGAEQL